MTFAKFLIILFYVRTVVKSQEDFKGTEVNALDLKNFTKFIR